MAPIIPAACPICNTAGCNRVDPLTIFETEMGLSATISPSVSLGIKAPKGMENEGTLGKSISGAFGYLSW